MFSKYLNAKSSVKKKSLYDEFIYKINEKKISKKNKIITFVFRFHWERILVEDCKIQHDLVASFWELEWCP